jgi:MFS family permease
MTATRVRATELLAHQDFRRLLLAQFLAQAADGFAQAIFAFVLILEPLTQGTPSRILALFVLTLVPYSLISPFLGVFVDRWSRRGLLAWTNLVRGTVLITIWAWGGALPGHSALFISVLLLLGLGRLFLTTKGAVLPVVLDEQHLLKANSLSGGGGMISALLGGAAGVELLRVITPYGGLTLAGVLYGGAALLALRLSSSFAHDHPHHRSLGRSITSTAEGLVMGVAAIWRRPSARLPLLAIYVLRTIGMVVAIAAILIIKKKFPGAGDSFGRLNLGVLALGAAGAGALAAALTAPVAARWLRQPGLITAGFAAAGVGIIALGGIVSVPALLGVTFIAGFGTFLTKVAVDAQVQEALPDGFRGRAFALYDILYNLASVTAAAIMVALESAPSRVILVAIGVVTLAITVVIAGAMRQAGMALT